MGFVRELPSAVFPTENSRPAETGGAFEDRVQESGEFLLGYLPKAASLSEIPAHAWATFEAVAQGHLDGLQRKATLLREKGDPQAPLAQEQYQVARALLGEIRVLHDQAELDRFKVPHRGPGLSDKDRQRFDALRIQAAEWQMDVTQVLVARRETDPEALQTFWDYFDACGTSAGDQAQRDAYRVGITSSLAAAEMLQSLEIGQVLYSHPDDDALLGIDLLVQLKNSQLVPIQLKAQMPAIPPSGQPQFVERVSDRSRDTDMTLNQQNLVGGMQQWVTKHAHLKPNILCGLLVYVPKTLHTRSEDKLLVDQQIGRVDPHFLTQLQHQARQALKVSARG